jgi:hypothetical protein
MKLTSSIGCGLLIFIVSLVFLSRIWASLAVFSYYADYNAHNYQTESAITNELWLQGLLNHPFTPPCYTLDTTTCVTAEEVRTHAGGSDSSLWWFDIALSAVPAVGCAAILYTALLSVKRGDGKMEGSLGGAGDVKIGDER